METERRVGAPGVSPRGAERGSHLIRHRTRTKSGGVGVACSEEQTATPRSSGLRSKEKFQPKEMCFFLTSTFIELTTDALGPQKSANTGNIFIDLESDRYGDSRESATAVDSFFLSNCSSVFASLVSYGYPRGPRLPL